MPEREAPPRLTAAALDEGGGRVRHGFFTRRGGVSRGIYDSLNCGFGSDDRAPDVAENRARAGAALGAAGESVVTCHQVHGREVVHVVEPWQPGASPKADGMVTDRPGIVLGVLAADCGPVLFADAQAGVVGACHAGWRGALAGITDATVEAMERLGARRNRIAAAVGPCIGPASYEVGPEFPGPFLAADAANARFFRQAARPGHHMFDLPFYLRAQLERLALGAVDLLARDTCAEAEGFFSYRRATHRGEADYGRNLSAIVLAG